MATMLKIKKESEETEDVKDLKPEYIKERLFYFSDAAHSLHQDTKSYEEHKTLDSFYTGLIEFRDNICELLMGYMEGKRIGSITVGKLPDYSTDASLKLVKQVLDFSYELYEWAENKHYCDVENTAQDLSGLAAKTAYLLTLK